jgi:hypothetical protein
VFPASEIRAKPQESMSKPPSSPEYLALDEIHPQVDLAGYHEYDAPVWHTYRIPGQHFLLVKRGAIKAKTPNGEFNAVAGDLLCFRAADHTEYGNVGTTDFFEMHIEFAPPPRHRLTPWLDDVGPIPIHLPLGAAYADMREVFETWCIELPRTTALARTRVMAAVWRMLAIIADVAKPASADTAIDRWQRVRLRLGADPTSRISVTQLADEMDLIRRPLHPHLQASFRPHAQGLARPGQDALRGAAAAHQLVRDQGPGAPARLRRRLLVQPRFQTLPRHAAVGAARGRRTRASGADVTAGGRRRHGQDQSARHPAARYAGMVGPVSTD